MRSNRNYYYTTERFFSFTFLFLHATHFLFQFRRDSRSVDFQPKHQIIVRRRYIICLLLLISSSADGFTRDHGRRSYGPPTILNVLSVIYGNPPLPPPPTKFSFVPEYQPTDISTIIIITPQYGGGGVPIGTDICCFRSS